MDTSMFNGRTVEARKHPIRLLFERIDSQLGISTAEVEITITETPEHNRGFRGQTGDVIALGYKDQA